MTEKPTVPHPLPRPLIELIAQRFRHLGEPMRVGELTEATGASQQNVSKHLGVLLNAGIVSRTKRGTSSVYAIADDTVFALCEQVCGGLRRQLEELELVLQGGGDR